MVLRDEVAGAEIRTKEQQVCRAGEFLVAEIDAKLGGFGIVPDELDGAIVSSHYFLFDIDESLLDRRFLNYYIRTAAFRDQVSAQGSTNYAAIRPAHVLGYTIPDVSLAEQRRIVARIEALAGKIAEAQRLRAEAAAEAEALAWSGAMARLPMTGTSRVSDFVSIQSGYAFKSEWFAETGVRLARNVNIGHGNLSWDQTARLPEARRNEFARFELSAGDILVSLDRPIISTGVKVARVVERDLPCLLLQRVGRVVFRDRSLDPDYFYCWLRSPLFVSAIDPGRSNGVPHISPSDIERIGFTLPPLAEQRRIVEYLDGLQARVEAVKRLQAETAAELGALLPAVLARAFRGAL